MRRYLLIVLLFLLPLQLSWAAVFAHIGHDTEVQAQHTDHHENPQADAASLDQSSMSASGDTETVDHADHCHTGCYSAFGPVSSLQPARGDTRFVSLPEAALRMVALTPPERPQWVRFA